MSQTANEIQNQINRLSPNRKPTSVEVSPLPTGKNLATATFADGKTSEVEWSDEEWEPHPRYALIDGLAQILARRPAMNGIPVGV